MAPPSLLNADGGDPPNDGRIRLSDIESQFRSLTSDAKASVVEQKTNVLVAGAIGGAALLASVYLHGRRRGKNRASVLEIRRI